MNPSGLLDSALKGDRRSLSKLLTLIESGELIKQHVKTPWTLGVTGPPGVGKSTLIGQLINKWVDSGEKVAVLAVDPSSPKSGGALLGDRMRMTSSDSGDSVFVRSLATRNHPGGLTSYLGSMINLLSRCGWSRIIIETVGSGQSEIRIVAFADRILLVEGPDRGDIVQAEKAGIIELADLIVINKSDLPNAQMAADSLKSFISLSNDSDPVEILLVSSHNGDGITELIDSIENIQLNTERESLRFQERLLSAWDYRLLSHPQFNSIINELSSGIITLEEALDLIGESNN